MRGGGRGPGPGGPRGRGAGGGGLGRPEGGAETVGWLPASRLVLPSILLVIAEKGEIHGYELANQLETLNPEARIEPGAVYRGLRRLEEEAYIISRWDTEGGGPARRLYSLTETGQILLASYNKAIEQRIVILQGLLKRLKNLPPR